MKKNRNYLLEKIIDIFRDEKTGKVLDLGCGDGDYAKGLKELGFEVIASDVDEKRFKYSEQVDFKCCDITQRLPFPDNCFDYVLLLEVIEHLRNPYAVVPEINRIIKEGGFLIISTPNVLSLKSRFRFVFEGDYEYFREPPLDQLSNPKENISNLHIIPYRYHKLEYLLAINGFKISNIFTSIYEGYELWFLLPIIKFQAWNRERCSLKRGGIDYRRINRILLSKELLFGRHLIIKAEKL
jgi:SAM-dependent methyltransferase